uniref:Uncharacterized protein n=1 Tax=Picea sitchensis TaxID=3332 RepID=A9P1Y5_PICSI|nr:unknown [Picea sitchensis]
MYQQHPSARTTGLCDCTQDCRSCCLTCFCPCVAFGQIAEIADSGNTSCLLGGLVYYLLMHLSYVSPCYACFYRKRLRAKFNLAEEPCRDCLVHCFCGCCALCQEYRELKNRGFDPALGWAVNMEKRQSAQAGIAMAPPMGQAMGK